MEAVVILCVALLEVVVSTFILNRGDEINVTLSVIILNVVMDSAVMWSVIVPSVVAPPECHSSQPH
jgi:hypothetical protein